MFTHDLVFMQWTTTELDNLTLKEMSPPPKKYKILKITKVEGRLQVRKASETVIPYSSYKRGIKKKIFIVMLCKMTDLSPPAKEYRFS